MIGRDFLQLDSHGCERAHPLGLAPEFWVSQRLAQRVNWCGWRVFSSRRLGPSAPNRVLSLSVAFGRSFANVGILSMDSPPALVLSCSGACATPAIWLYLGWPLRQPVRCRHVELAVVLLGRGQLGALTLVIGRGLKACSAQLRL
jgi:hypothetical protein